MSVADWSESASAILGDQSTLIATDAWETLVANLARHAAKRNGKPTEAFDWRTAARSCTRPGGNEAVSRSVESSNV
jgi:hypothetical protein